MKLSSQPVRAHKPVTVLIAALGGQGGGVLTDWIVAAARATGAIVQATSTPGVSQRTGATTYYIEIAVPASAGATPPALGLAPVPGQVDVLVCAELLEAARMLERGMSVPSRTTIVASTHRVYTTREKMSGGDARFDDRRIGETARALSKRAVLFDMEAIRRRHGTVISAALFGALAGSGALPVERAACTDAIREGGKGAAASLAAFDEAFVRAQPDVPAADAGGVPAPSAQLPGDNGPSAKTAGGARTAPLPPAIARGVAALPARVAEFARLGAADLVDYQDESYAVLYLDRIARILIAEGRANCAGREAHEVAREAARYLALWMRYDDVVRVASRKVRASRLAQIRGAAAASAGSIVRVYDYFKPSALEVAAILPRRLGAWLERQAIAANNDSAAATAGVPRASANRGVTLQTTSIAGALLLRGVAALRPLRPHSLRYAREQQAIEDWLAALELACTHDRIAGGKSALAVARLPGLIRGYGDAHAAGRANFQRILDAYRRASVTDPLRAGRELRERALAALNDPACGTSARRPAAAAARSAAASSPA